MGIKIGLVGLGQFGKSFADVFKAHPLVNAVAYCDSNKELLAGYAKSPFLKEKFNSRDIYCDIKDIYKAEDIDALVIITQPWLHAEHALEAIKHDKDIFCAVPLSYSFDYNQTLDDCAAVIEACEKHGKHYMTAETSFFSAEAQFCRRMYKEGKFGDVVYAEGEYMHDLDSYWNLRRIFGQRKENFGQSRRDKMIASLNDKGFYDSAFFYSTHSLAGPMSVRGAKAKKVSAIGYRNKTQDPFFKDWIYSNGTALFQMDDGSTLRIAETREAAGKLGKGDITMRVMGTLGTFSEGLWYEARREGPYEKRFSEKTLDYSDMFDPMPEEIGKALVRSINKDAVEPEKLEFKPWGHSGSYPFLVHEFVMSIIENRQPQTNAYVAAAYLAAGITAHKSALKDGEQLKVPDFGSPKE